MQKRFVKVTYALIFFSLLTACAHTKSMPAESGVAADSLAGMIWFYQGPLDHLNAVRMGECPMYPSCSRYSFQSIQKHGALMGWIMTMDRLMRCGRDETRLTAPIIVDGRLKYYDPVEKNDFWWSDR